MKSASRAHPDPEATAEITNVSLEQSNCQFYSKCVIALAELWDDVLLLS